MAVVATVEAMTAFFDSSVLVKAYTIEANSGEAARLVTHFGPSLVFTALQENEVRNALRLKCARREITPAELAESEYAIDFDKTAGTLQSRTVGWADVWFRAECLSALHTHTTFARTLDLLHIATALHLGLMDFVSFDRRQCAVAGRVGLRVA